MPEFCRTSQLTRSAALATAKSPPRPSRTATFKAAPDYSSVGRGSDLSAQAARTAPPPPKRSTACRRRLPIAGAIASAGIRHSASGRTAPCIAYDPEKPVRSSMYPTSFPTPVAPDSPLCPGSRLFLSKRHPSSIESTIRRFFEEVGPTNEERF